MNFDDEQAMRKVSEKNLAWLGGILDGEGCVGAYWWKQTNPKCRDNHGMRVSVQISNTHPLIIEKITEVLVDLGVPFSYESAQRTRFEGREKPTVTVNVMGKARLLKLLPTIIPYTTAKRRQCELALELIQYRESLATHNRVGTKGRFGNMNLRDDDNINRLMEEIKREKKEFPSVLDYSRFRGAIFGHPPLAN